MISNFFISNIRIFFVSLLIMIPCITHAKKMTVTPADSYATELLKDRYLEDNNEIGEKELVNSEKMALELAEIYVRSFYGDKNADKQKPYLIADNKTEWIITGQMPKTPRFIVGGTFLIVISKIDGKVIGLMHDK